MVTVIVSMTVPAHLAGLLCHDPANIQLQLANRLPAACYVQQLAAQARPQMFHIH